MSVQSKTGAYEWGKTFVNITTGCGCGPCRYCYAREMLCRFGLCSKENWNKPVIREKEISKKRPLYKHQTVFFQTTSDITVHNLVACYTVLKKLLDAGNQVLIVSKPNWYCVTTLCNKLEKYKNQILFRFTIGSTNNEVLKFWEPNARSFDERLKCLQYAFVSGYQTSISCEPFLDDNVMGTYNACKDFVSDSFWIGKLNGFGKRVDLTDITNEQIERFVNPLKKLLSDENIWKLYNLMNSLEHIKWKDSIRKVVNI